LAEFKSFRTLVHFNFFQAKDGRLGGKMWKLSLNITRLG
jgi:hypothetical protein